MRTCVDTSSDARSNTTVPVRQARAAGVVTLERGRHAERFEVHEADSAEAIPVLRQYMVQVPVTRPSFDAAPDASDDQIAAELPDASGMTGDVLCCAFCVSSRHFASRSRGGGSGKSARLAGWHSGPSPLPE